MEDGKPYREFCVPAEVVNQYGPLTIHEADFEGCTRDMVMNKVEMLKEAQHHERMKYLLEVQLPFLERHGLLEET